jgi:hypothetical protein
LFGHNTKRKKNIMPIELPLTVIEASDFDPRSLLIYGPPKVGKTSMVAEIPGILIIDLEDGSDFVSAMKLKINNLDELNELILKIQAANKEKNGYLYKYIAVDTISKLEDLILPLANQLYRATPMGKNFSPNGNVLTLPKGAGYLYHRIAMKKVLDLLKSLCEHLILIGHVREATLDKGGKEHTSLEVQLTGQLRSIVPSMCDAVGYVHRNSENGDVMIDFKGYDLLSGGSRPKHISGKNIVISEYNEEDNSHACHWERIFRKLEE